MSSIPENIADNQHITMYARTDISTGLVTVVDVLGKPVSGAPIGMTYFEWERWASQDILKKWMLLNQNRDYSSDLINLAGTKEDRFRDDWYGTQPPLRIPHRAYPSQIDRSSYFGSGTTYYP